MAGRSPIPPPPEDREPSSRATEEASRVREGEAIEPPKSQEREETADKLAREAAEGEHERTQSALSTLAGLFRLLISTIILLLAGAISVWAAHLMLPVKAHWLTPEQVATLQTIVLSAVVIGAVSDYLRRYLGR